MLRIIRNDSNASDGRAFGDLAVQVHYGDREPGVWHNDALNSVLHLGVSVRGKRFLLSRQFEGGKPRTARVELAAGSVYLSSPALFKHAVEYPSSAYEERILAVQARFLLSVQEYTDLEEDWKKCGVRGQQEIADVMKCVLSANSLVLPVAKGVLPHGLRKLKFGWNFKHNVEEGALPDTLETLEYPNPTFNRKQVYLLAMSVPTWSY